MMDEEDIVIKPSGLLCLDNKREIIIVPMKNVRVKCKIQGFTAKIVARQSFFNSNDQDMDVVYVFPVDPKCAVYEFEGQIDDRIVTAECQEKKEAKATFEAAASSGYTSFLLEEDTKSPEIFTCTIGNLKAQSFLQLTIKMVQELKLEEDGSVSLTLPQVLAPRCETFKYRREKSDDISPMMRDPWGPKRQVKFICTNYTHYEFHLDAYIRGAGTLQRIESVKTDAAVSSNMFTTNLSQDLCDCHVTLKQPEGARRETNLRIYYSDPHQPHVRLERGNPKLGGLFKQHVCMLTFLPQFSEQLALEADLGCATSEFLFFVDRSASMDGLRMDQCKDTLLLFLKSLPSGCRFQVVSFGTTHNLLFPTGSQPYNRENLTTALQLLSTMKADMEGTDIFSPLEAVLASPPVDGKLRQVFLLTDGSVTNPEEVCALLHTHAHNTRVFGIGLGSSASSALVNGASRAGKGRAEFVLGKERLQGKVMNLLQSALQAPVQDLALDWELPFPCTPVQLPETIPSLFHGDRLILYAVLDCELPTESQSCAVTLRGRIGETPIDFRLEFETGTEDDKRFDTDLPIRRLAVKRQIRDLVAAQEEDDDICRPPSKKKVHNEELITQLSKEANIVSKYTSFVGVDKVSTLKIDERPVREPNYALEYHLRHMNTHGGFRMLPIYNMPAKKKSKPIALGPPPKRPADYIWWSKSEKKEEWEKLGITKSNRMIELIQLQDFDGNWDLSERFATILGAPVDKIRNLKEEFEEAVWATALALALLELKFSKQNAEWRLLAEKAQQWLLNTLENKSDFEELKAKATKLVEK